MTLPVDFIIIIDQIKALESQTSVQLSRSLFNAGIAKYAPIPPKSIPIAIEMSTPCQIFKFEVFIEGIPS